MAALLRQGTRRIGGSLLQQTQSAAVQRRMLSAGERAPEEITRDIKRKQQELADAIAEGRRTLMASTNWRDQDLSGSLRLHQRPSAQELQQKKEELYEVLSKVENFWNRRLLQDLALHVKPKPEDEQWRRLRVGRRISDFGEITGAALFVSFVLVLNSGYEPHNKAVKR